MFIIVQRRKAIIIIINLLLVCFLLFVVYLGFDLNLQKSETIQASIKNAQIESLASDVTAEKGEIENLSISANEGEHPESSNTTADEAAGLLEKPSVETTVVEADAANDKPTIAEEIKEKVREVMVGTINFFSKDQKIVSIGDSLTQGVGDETASGGYVGILNHTFEDHNLNITIENYGKKGNRTDQLLKRLENEEIATSIKEADIVLMTIGSNDIMKVVKNNFINLQVEPFQQEKQRYTERLTAIFNRVNELNPDVQIYLIGFYNPFEPFFGDIEEVEMIMDNWNEAGQSVTEEFENVNYIPIADLFMNSTNELLAEDNFHPNTSGYLLIAERV